MKERSTATGFERIEVSCMLCLFFFIALLMTFIVILALLDKFVTCLSDFLGITIGKRRRA